MRLSLSHKFLLAVTLVLGAVIAAMTTLQVLTHQADLDAEMAGKGADSSALLAAAAVQPLLNDDRQTLLTLAQFVLRDPAVIEVQIANLDGDLRVAAGASNATTRPYRLAIEDQQGLVLGEVTLGLDSHHYEARVQAAIRESVLVMVGTGLVLMAYIAFMLHRIVIRPLRGAVKRLDEVSAGDFRTAIQSRGDDEIGQLFRAMQTTVAALRSHITQVSDSGQRLSQASDQLRSVADDTRQAVARQHGETDEIARTINEMSSTVNDIARSAAETAEASTAASSESANGRQVVQSTVQSINDLAAELDATATTIANLEASTARIGGVLDVINGIAEQTNLLALNAAIEAARAGEQGRGFAVVAEEVRTLARRTEQSTQEIKTMIEALQKEARSAVAAVHAGNEKAKHTVLEAANADQALRAINQQVNTMAEMTTRIASAAEQQRAVTQDINRNVVNISAEANATEQGARRTSEAGESLGALVTELKSLSTRFQI